ncbi:MAG: hypothetical protein V3V99_13775 [candidate division Zixibacteria bacterium]
MSLREEGSNISKKSLILCGPYPHDNVDKSGFKKIINLDTSSISTHNVNLKLFDISKRLAQNPSPLILDMLEVGSYVYCADQAITRGGRTWKQDGKDWNRDFVLHIPVRNPERWNDSKTKELLEQALGFLSDDMYEFHFSKLKDEIPIDQYFDFQDTIYWSDAEEVILFSGGLDSLAATVDVC